MQYVVAAALLLVIVAMLPGLVSAAATRNSQYTGNPGSDMMTSPNAVTRSFGYTLAAASKASKNLSSAMAGASGAAASAVAHSGSIAVNVVVSSGRFVAHTASTTVRSVGHAAYLTARMPASAIGHAQHAMAGINVLRPASAIATPAIDPASAVLAAATTPASSVLQARAAVVNSGDVAWPLHGTVTTLFGVPEPPYQPTHTGIDISDGEPAGVSPIHAFKAGVVVQVIHEHIKLGNEVVIDHGGGMTSVYGHLDSISAYIGEAVSTRTVIGQEGTTGVSTGPHLHFEIRINGTPVNPAKFIPGRP